MVQALSTLTSPKGVITIDGFSSNIAPISRADNEILKSIDFDEAGLKREFQVSSWIRGIKGHTVVKELVFGPTCTICGIQTGHTEAGPKTVLPGSAVARLDFRLVPDLTPTLVTNLLRAHLDARGFKDVEIVGLGSIPTAKSAGDSLVARAAIAAAEEVYEKNPVIYPLHPSSGPAGIICGVNDPPVPVISFGTAYSGSNPHGPDENIRMDDFIENIRFFGRLIHNLAARQVAQFEEPETRELILPV
jgi:acetylornithine deacetylase/succinyl-diaminopimelate desuccinylase-like protein